MGLCKPNRRNSKATKNSSVHRCLAKSVANWKELSNFIFGPFFKFLGNQGELEKTEATKIFVDVGVSF